MQIQVRFCRKRDYLRISGKGRNPVMSDAMNLRRALADMTASILATEHQRLTTMRLRQSKGVVTGAGKESDRGSLSALSKNTRHPVPFIDNERARQTIARMSNHRRAQRNAESLDRPADYLV